MRKSRLVGMTESELDEMAFDLDECQSANGRPLSLTRWRTRMGSRIKEVQEQAGLGERKERFSPAWIYMLYASDALAEADKHDAEELPFRLYEKYGERFAVPEEPQPPQEPPKTEPAPLPAEPSPTTDDQQPTTEMPPPATDPAPPPTEHVPTVPDVPIVSKVPTVPSPQPPAEPPPTEDPPDSPAIEVDWSAF